MSTPPYGPPAQQYPYGQQPGGGYPPPGFAVPGYGAPAPGYGPPIASMGQRLGARVLDWVFLGVPLATVYVLLILWLASTVEETGEPGPGPVVGLLVFVGIASIGAVAYEVSLIAVRGATLGKQIVGIRVLREQDGQPPGWGSSVLRWVIPYAGAAVCGIGQLVVYLSPFFDDSGRRQGWHDKIAKTLVVRTK